MALATAERFEELIIDVEFTPESGVYTPICGMIDATITRTANIDSAEVPDCEDESKPLALQKEVRSIEVGASGTGVWAQSSAGKLLNWFYSGQPLNVRLRNTKAAVGEIEVESGPALLASIANTRTKGQRVSAEIELTFSDGIPTTTNKS